MKRKSLSILIGSLLGVTLAVTVVIVVLYVIAINVGYAFFLVCYHDRRRINIFKTFCYALAGLAFSIKWIYGRSYIVKNPGISSSKDAPQEAFNTLKPYLTKLLTEHIPKDKRKSTMLYLGATAGMRLVNLESPLKADAIIEDLRRALPDLGVTVYNPYSDIRIISGSDEGIYAWITVNYLLKKLGDKGGRRPEPADQMMGALDLGGASTQITFVPENANSALHTGRRQLFGNVYNVYSYSYLCYGKSASQLRIWAEIIGQQTNNRINNPCLLKNYELTVKKSKLFTEPCVISKFAVEIFGSEIIPDPALGEDITFVGTGEPTQCRTIVQRLFRSANCTTEPCSFNGVYQPPPKGNFLAFAGFYYVINFLFPSGGKGLTRDQVKIKVDKFCTMDWNTESAKHPADQHANVAGYCLDGIYVDNLLDGYGFKTNELWQKIEFVSKVAGASVSWALGYVIDASGKVESLAPKIDLGQPAFVGSVTVLSIVLVALLGILIYVLLNR